MEKQTFFQKHFKPFISLNSILSTLHLNLILTGPWKLISQLFQLEWIILNSQERKDFIVAVVFLSKEKIYYCYSRTNKLT